jgi:hypothetical protein
MGLRKRDQTDEALLKKCRKRPRRRGPRAPSKLKHYFLSLPPSLLLLGVGRTATGLSSRRQGVIPLRGLIRRSRRT